MKRGFKQNTVSWYDRASVEDIVKLIYDELPIAKEDAFIERAMQVYDRIRLTYEDHNHYTGPEGVCRCTTLNSKGGTIVTAMAVVALVEALSDKQYDTYKPIYTARRKAMIGEFFNDVHHLLRDHGMRLINYAGVSDAATFCMDSPK